MTAPDRSSGSAAGGALRLAAEVAPAVLVLGALLWQVRAVLSPIVLLALLLLVLWPERRHPFVARLLVAAGSLTALWILSVTGALLAPFVLGLAFAYLLAPAVAWLARKRVPRALAIVLTLLPFLAALVLLVVVVVPALERQVVDFAARLPALLQRFGQWLVDTRSRFLESSPGLLSPEQEAWLRNLQPSDLVALVQQRWNDIAQGAWSAFVGLGKGVGTVVTVVLYVVVTPVVTFYLLASWERFTGSLSELVPPARRERVFGFLGEYDRLLGRYVRGALTEATLVGFVTWLGLALLGFPGALLLGVVSGICNLAPYVGFAISAVVGVFLALVSGAVVPSLIKVAVIFGITQIMDGSITGPRIVGGAVGLNPVWVMIALAFFGVLLGFVGVLVAVPLAILIRLVVERAVERYRASSYFGAPAAAPAAPAPPAP